MDRMDYLIRDSHYTGVTYGIIDVDRIISNLKLKHYLILDKKRYKSCRISTCVKISNVSKCLSTSHHKNYKLNV
jgi:HD superfamily phosphohydrolase